MKNSKVLASLLIGAAAGAVLGLLLAPEKGSETRKKISKKTNEFGENVKNKFGEVKDKFGEVKETLKGKYDSIRTEANDIMEKEKDAQRNFG